MRHRGEASGKALRPGRATQAGGGHPDHRAGDRNAGLGEDHGSGDQPLGSQTWQRQQVHQSQEEAVHQVNRNQRNAATAATAPHRARTAIPTPSMAGAPDRLTAHESASVNAPDGVSLATQDSAAGIVPD